MWAADGTATRKRATRRTTLLLLGFLLAGVAGCGDGSVEPLPLRINLQASRTTAAPGQAIEFVVTAQGATLVGVTIEYGDGETDLYATAGARTARVTFGYAYSTAGTYQVVATVIDAQAGEAEATLEVRIQ